MRSCSASLSPCSHRHLGLGSDPLITCAAACLVFVRRSTTPSRSSPSIRTSMEFADGRFGGLGRRTPVTEPHGCAGRSQGPASAREALRWRVGDYHRHALTRQHHASPKGVRLDVSGAVGAVQGEWGARRRIVHCSTDLLRAPRRSLRCRSPRAAPERARDKARQTLVVMGRFAFRCGRGRALLYKGPAGAAAGGAVRTSSPEPLVPASPPLVSASPEYSTTARDHHDTNLRHARRGGMAAGVLAAA